MNVPPPSPPETDGPLTLYEKLWRAHTVRPETPETPALLYVDLHLIHEVTSPQAFAALAERGLPVRRPERTFATVDHSVPTLRRSRPLADGNAEAQVLALEMATRHHGIPFAGLGSPDQGIVHVIGPERGLTRPGMTVVCGDSHTSTHGAFGALAFGIGTTEVLHVLATQCLLQRRARTLRTTFEGSTSSGVTAKDLALAWIRRIGVNGALGHVVEFAGPAVEALSMEGRMTLCNMSVEASARTGLIASDHVTGDFLAAVGGSVPEPGENAWRTDAGATFDREVVLDASSVEPMITYGTHPGMSVGIRERIPDALGGAHPADATRHSRALAYMGLEPGQPLEGTTIDVAFLGSCTNGRLSDLRAAASILRGRRIASGVRMLVVPGSTAVKRKAESEGLRDVFAEAGAEWREAGCSLCIAMNGDALRPGERAVSASNRNFEGRQGRAGRTLLASPFTVAASAVEGRVADPRPFLEGST